MQRKYFILLAALLLLAGCKSTALTLNLTFATEDPTLRSLLITTSERVIERIAFGIEEEIPTISVRKLNGTTKIIVTLKEKESAAILMENLTRPIMLHLTREAEEGETPDIMNEQYGSFVETGLTEKQISWITAEEVGGAGAKSQSHSRKTAYRSGNTSLRRIRGNASGFSCAEGLSPHW